MKFSPFYWSAFVFALTTFRVVAATNFFPVMAWNHAPNDPAVLKKMRECGLTVAGFANPSTLDACQAAGLKAVVNDPRCGDYDWPNVDDNKARTNIASLVGEVGKHPAVYGYYLRDEPPASFFPGLAKVAAHIHELDPEKWAYINLFPNYAEPWQLGTANYAEYLDKFVASCKPTVLSYDHYALLDDGSLRGGYFQNLEQMRTAALKNKLPFWNIVLSVAHFNYREPTAADLRFQVFSTLAYGGKGIAYFTYFASETGNYRGAPIDQFGNPTAAWDWMQNVNLQIEKLAPILLQLTSDDVYHFGAVPDGCHAPGEKSLVKASADGNFMCGDFTHHDGSRYVMLVNRDVVKSHVCSPQFRVAPKKVQKISSFSGNAVAFEGEQLWVAPGHGVLLKLE
ncbi:MAG: hypothetical protein ABI042_01395 [Verrucomicrobiota bacterium]